MLRSATCIAAAEAAPSAPGVSRIASVKPFPLKGGKKGRQARRPRRDDFYIARATSFRPVRERALRIHVDDANLFLHLERRHRERRCDGALPEPPFWVTNAMIRMNSALSLPVSLAPRIATGAGVNEYS